MILEPINTVPSISMFVYKKGRPLLLSCGCEIIVGLPEAEVGVDNIGISRCSVVCETFWC